jgi:RNA polymerase sigma-70 factor (ECF subfamily)
LIVQHAAIFCERYTLLIQRAVTRVLGHDVERADVAQEVLLIAFRSLHSLRDPNALEPWLASIATLTARKFLRTRARRRSLCRLMDRDERAQEDRHEPDDVPDIEARRALSAVQVVLERLPADDRVPFTLRHIHGLELLEVADACYVSLATIKRRLLRAERRFFANARNYPELLPWVSRSAVNTRLTLQPHQPPSRRP